MELTVDLRLLRGRRVLVTGHTGFKGSWLSQILVDAGAEVAGLSLPPEKGGLFELLGLDQRLASSSYCDIRDGAAVRDVVVNARPEIVFHLAAQPLVLESYRDPAYTFAVNVQGTVHLLDSLRELSSVRSVVNVTTDKVYENPETGRACREDDRLNGFDPYSNSKSCSELVTASFVNSFLRDAGVAVSTARAGNVIGGGDFAADRIVPDCVRAALAGDVIRVRHPGSVRPYQHVLEPISAYLLIATRQLESPALAGAYNIGPRDQDTLSTADLVKEFCRAWGRGVTWKAESWQGPREAGLLRLDSARISERLGWSPRWSAQEAIGRVVDWTEHWAAGADPAIATKRQIAEYFASGPAT